MIEIQSFPLFPVVSRCFPLFPVVSRCSRSKVKWQSSVRKGILLKTLLKESQKTVAMTVFMEARDF